MGRLDDRYEPARGAPTGYNTRTVCEMLQMRMGVLFGYVRQGCLPPPDWFAGELLWPLWFPRFVRTNGPSLPGTYPGFPPGVDPDAELLRWRLAGPSRNLRYSARAKRESTKATKRRKQK